ncbi:MAG: hypothetical protein IH914_11175 [candidate division Zixibacteria bacterium]|nr:hypothetical protein [candidate division Zixibacteria bacterium]
MKKTSSESKRKTSSAKTVKTGKTTGRALRASTTLVKKTMVKNSPGQAPDRLAVSPNRLTRQTVSTRVAVASSGNQKPAKGSGAKYYFHFGSGRAEGSRDDIDILGGKGAGLCEMSAAGIPVPPGFVISAAVCRLFYDAGLTTPGAIDKQLEENVRKLEKQAGALFGDPENPLLLSVRSGSKFSMPGMMDTILNLGLNQQTLDGLVNKTGNARFAHDNYRRLIQMFGNVVLGIDRGFFEASVEKIKKDRRIKNDSSLQVKDLKDIISRFKSIIKRKSGEEFPDDPMTQLRLSRDAVFKSWNNPRAISYRRMNDIPSHLGTAVTIQAMVFGNSGPKSGTGVGFTRNPSTGENEFFGEYLQNAQGEDVVAGIRTPQPIARLGKDMPAVRSNFFDLGLSQTDVRNRLRMLQTLPERLSNFSDRSLVEFVIEHFAGQSDFR